MQIREYFEHALEFLKQKQRAETFASAVVHLDEKTPHMHVTFVPLTEDNRLSAKEIIGNKAKLSQWQSAYWEHMVSKYPDLERGESADKTDRKHIPPRVFKEMTHLAKQSRKIEAVMDDATMYSMPRASCRRLKPCWNDLSPAWSGCRPSLTSTKSLLRIQLLKTLL